MSDFSETRKQRQVEDKHRRDVLGDVPVDESTRSIEMRDGHMSEMRIFKPRKAQVASSPLVVLIYGGGFITGDNQSHTPWARPISAVYDAVVVNISYRLSPEYRFPTAPNDVWDSLQWLAAHANALGADPSKGFILGGESAGGNLAAVVAVKAMQEQLSPPLTGVWLSIPWLLNAPPKEYKELYLATEQNATVPFLNQEAVDFVTAVYAPDESSPDFSPFNSLDLLKDHPPTYIQVCGMDPLRDDGLIYANVLRDHGVKVKVDVYPGVPHAFWAFAPFFRGSKKSMIDAVVGFSWLMGKKAALQDIKTSLGKLGSDD